jgi:hypothetical protein
VVAPVHSATPTKTWPVANASVDSGPGTNTNGPPNTMNATAEMASVRAADRGTMRDRHRASTYRIVYRIDEGSRVVHVLDVDYCSDVYHRPQK